MLRQLVLSHHIMLRLFHSVDERGVGSPCPSLISPDISFNLRPRFRLHGTALRNSLFLHRFASRNPSSDQFRG